MIKKAAFLSITLISSTCFSFDVSFVSKACHAEKKKSEFCTNLLEIEKNSTKMGEHVIEKFNLQTPFAVGAFFSDPKYNISFKSHDLTIRPQSISYRYEF